jgi:signal transduction histidine kinase/CheY-like chemotaxis protein
LSIKNEMQLNQILSNWSTMSEDSDGLERKPSNKLIRILLILFLLSFIILVLLRFIRHRSAQQKSLINRVDSITQTKSKLKLTESNLEKRIEERIQVLVEEIKERERVDQELKAALLKAEDANYLKNAFLANMSHEIRTPLNGIMGSANLLELELALIEKPELFEYANSIQKSGERLLHLLNNIIDISRIEANELTMHIKPISLKPLIDQVIELNTFSANEKGIKIVADSNSDQVVLADRDTLFRVFNEIIDNSIKYTEKGYIKLVVEKKPDGDFIAIEIKDTGIGIDSAYLPFIFEAFRQESLGYTRQYQGAGLGLPLAKRLMNLMGGQLEVFSEKKSGTTILIHVPTKEIDSENTEIQNLENKNIERAILPKDLKILVIEDDQSSRLVISKMLEMYGTVKSVPDGDSALKQIQNLEKENHHFEILFVDINLPAPWDGIGLREAILKKYPFYRNVPFIAQTAYAMSGDRERIMASGFDYYMSKPVNHHMILEAINLFYEKILLSRHK